MGGVNVTIKQDIKKRKRIFIAPDGKSYEGGPEAYFNARNDLGGNGRTAGLPGKFKKA